MAVVTVPEYQQSLAIGSKGQNVRLAAKLTGWKIDIKKPGDELEEEKPGEPDDTEDTAFDDVAAELLDTAAVSEEIAADDEAITEGE